MKSKKKYNRRVLREKVLQILYAYEINRDGLENLIEGILTDLSEDADREFCRRLVNSVLSNQKVLDLKIGDRVDNWELNRIAIIDKILLRMGIAEFMYWPDIPPKVTINEIIEIAKDFSTNNSGKFINGILDTILDEMKEKETLNKTGRGLLEDSLQRKHEKEDEEQS